MNGVEGKIKGGGVTTQLTPCLHIVFHASTPKGGGVTVLARTPIGLEESGVSPCMRPLGYHCLPLVSR